MPSKVPKQNRQTSLRMTEPQDDGVKRVALAEGNSPAAVIRRFIATGLERERRLTAADESRRMGFGGGIGAAISSTFPPEIAKDSRHV